MSADAQSAPELCVALETRYLPGLAWAPWRQPTPREVAAWLVAHNAELREAVEMYKRSPDVLWRQGVADAFLRLLESERV